MELNLGNDTIMLLQNVADPPIKGNLGVSVVRQRPWSAMASNSRILLPSASCMSCTNWAVTLAVTVDTSLFPINVTFPDYALGVIKGAQYHSQIRHLQATFHEANT